MRAWAERGPSPRPCGEQEHRYSGTRTAILRGASACSGRGRCEAGRPPGPASGGSALARRGGVVDDRAAKEARTHAEARTHRSRGLVAAAAALVAAWRRNPRIGTRFINEVVNPYLVARGIAGAGRSELGTLEHVGRRTGTRHLTPIRPVPTEDGFRIMVPLGPKSEWARNVARRRPLPDAAARHGLRARRAGPAGGRRRCPMPGCRSPRSSTAWDRSTSCCGASPRGPAPSRRTAAQPGAEPVARRSAEQPGPIGAVPEAAAVRRLGARPGSRTRADASALIPFAPMTADPDRHALEQALAGRGQHELFACDPALADTAAFCAAYGFALEDSANTIIVAGKSDSARLRRLRRARDPSPRRQPGRPRRRLGTRKASFASPEETRALTGHEIGGVTAFGLPAGLPLWVDAAVMARDADRPRRREPQLEGPGAAGDPAHDRRRRGGGGTGGAGGSARGTGAGPGRRLSISRRPWSAILRPCGCTRTRPA